ncbi:MAG: MATE family multidrug resistance protein [Chlamydiales bacterium]|jgi:MATE family multidrug resistance protein
MTTKSKIQKLTRHPEGSIKEMFAISFPLMLSVLSGSVMLFLDRLILAKFSLEAMNAAAAAGMVIFVFHYGAIGISSIAEVFVGQHNGAGEKDKAASPAWQMIWFSLFCWPVFFAIAHWGGPLFLADYHYESHALPYFQWLLYFGPLFPMQTAISAFFIGIGSVRIVTKAAIIGNVLNVILDILLVFGFREIIPAMGCEGAAIATVISMFIQVLVLLSSFLNKHYNLQYGTRRYGFKIQVFWNCLKVGVPSAMGHMIEISAWALITRLLIGVGEDHITVAAMGQCFYALISYAMEGLQKGITTISANFLGARKPALILKAWKSAVRLLFIYALLVAPILLLYPDPIISFFLSDDMNPERLIHLTAMLRITAACIFFYFVLDGLTWISAGVLTAAGETTYVMIINTVTTWTFAVLPVYFLVVQGDCPPSYVWVILNGYAAINALCFYLRFRKGSWKTKRLV